MASVIMHSFNKINAEGKMMLFRSHKPGIMDGHQSRDFIYVKDIAEMCMRIMKIMTLKVVFITQVQVGPELFGFDAQYICGNGIDATLNLLIHHSISKHLSVFYRSSDG